MHTEAYTWLETTLKRYPPDGLHVLEFGSYNINGGARALCGTAASYLGIDTRAGPGVDVVGDAAEWDGPPYAHLLICTEVLEHHPEPWLLIDAAYRALVPGGRIILTAASTGRTPHGATGTAAPLPGEHYRNIEPMELQAWLDAAGFTGTQQEYHPWPGDIYATAVKE